MGHPVETGGGPPKCCHKKCCRLRTDSPAGVSRSEEGSEEGSELAGVLGLGVPVNRSKAASSWPLDMRGILVRSSPRAVSERSDAFFACKHRVGGGGGVST